MSYGWAKDADTHAQQPIGYLCSVSDHEDKDEADHWEEHAFETFPEARRWMFNRLLVFVDDSCEDCQEAGRQAILTLVIASKLRWWLAEVDGIHYAIRSVKVTV